MSAAPLEWSPSLAVGVDEIDAQHRSLFAQARRFDEAVRSREPSRQLEVLFGFLVRYAEEHFASEERLLLESGYPGAEAHVREHHDFRRRLGSLIPHWESEGDSPALLLALSGFLSRWLLEHVGASDRALGEYLRTQP
jgi:hemerythrin